MRFSFLFAAVMGASLSAQIATDLVDKRKTDFHTQATEADMKREGGTQPRDWDYNLPDGVTTRQITFYVDGGTPLYGKLFFPKGFRAADRRPAVVVGHGINALSIGIEKYGARFAERGLVAMAIDYQSYGFSGSGSDDLRLLETDPTTDAQLVAEKRLRLVVKRTNLNNAHEVDDYRAAISYLQGEPGVDADRIGIWARVRIRRKRLIPDAQMLDIRNAISYLQGEPGVDRGRIGLWGADLAGGHVVTMAATDIRVKAAVAQTPIIEGKDVARKATAPSAEHQAERVRLARTGQPPSTAVAAAAMNDREARLAVADYHPFWNVDAVPQTIAILFVLAEKDLKVNNDANAVAASKLLKGPNGVTMVPGATHAMSTASAFDAAVEAAAAWFQKYL
jgi:dienelactone hydrolase